MDNYAQIREGLTNFLFSCLASFNLDEKDSKQVLIGILLEEVLKLAKDEDDITDWYTLKPLSEAVIRLLRERIEILKGIPNTDNAIKNYENIIKAFQVFIDEIKK